MLAATQAALCYRWCLGRSCLSGALDHLQEPGAEGMGPPATPERPGLPRPQRQRPQEIAQHYSAGVLRLLLWQRHTGGAGLQRARTTASTGQAPNWAHMISGLSSAGSVAGVHPAPLHLRAARHALALHCPAGSAHLEDVLLACSVQCRW